MYKIIEIDGKYKVKLGDKIIDINEVPIAIVDIKNIKPIEPEVQR